MPEEDTDGSLRCVVCDAKPGPDVERAQVRCNVRSFGDESFDVWRCAACASIHASEDVDLDHYYAGYPVFGAELDWKLKVVYGSLLTRLTDAGVRPDGSLLDYGCGKGLLVEYLRTSQFDQAVGYDPYAPGFDDRSLLEQRYDAIVSQDVIEHVDDPRQLMRQFDEMLVPGGIAAIGTPDAAALGLDAPEDYVHALHQPYHRHILSMDALKRCGEQLGWEVTAEYSTMYNNTLVPTMNPRFVLHYVRCHDDFFDLVTEPVRLSWRLLTPATPFYALFGYFFDRGTDITVIFRKPA